MSYEQEMSGRDKAGAEQTAPAHAAGRDLTRTRQNDPEMLVGRATLDRGSLTAGDVLRLQRAVGNQAVRRLLRADAAAPRGVQPGLKVGASRDVYEQQADRVAEQVLSAATPATHADRRRAEDGREGVRVTPFAESGATAVQRREAPGAEARARADWESRLDAARGKGSPLPDGVRAFMEPRFGADFGGVRVHTGGEAARLNRSLGAHAFTHGSDIYYGEGKSPGNDHLTAHELTHVAQQAGGEPSAAAVQTQLAPEAPAAESAEEKTRALIKDAEEAVEGKEGKLEHFYAEAEFEGEQVFVMFDDSRVHKLHRHLLKQWLGVEGVDNEFVKTPPSTPPKWAAEYRTKALNVRSRKETDPDFNAYAEQKRLADLAVKLADSVADETPAQRLRRQFVRETDKSIGSTVMTQAEIDAEREKPATGGLTPKNFTTCIAFFCQMAEKLTKTAGITSPLILGPNHYKEINPQAEESLPEGAWRPCKRGSRPRPGDLLIFTFLEDEKEGGKLKFGKGWFAHISILRAVEPVKDASSVPKAAAGATEKWVSVDGGGTTANEVVRYFNPDDCTIVGPGTLKRTLHGWIDIEKVAEAKLLKKTLGV